MVANGDATKSPAHVEKCLKTLRSCVANASDGPSTAPASSRSNAQAPASSRSNAPAPASKPGTSNYEIEAYNADEGEETYEGEGEETYEAEGEETYEGEGEETYEGEGEETYVLEGAPYVSTGMTRMGVLVRILFAIFLILFVLYMAKQV